MLIQSEIEDLHVLAMRADGKEKASFRRGEITRAFSRAMVGMLPGEHRLLPLPKSIFWAREFCLKANSAAHQLWGSGRYSSKREGSSLLVTRKAA